MSEAQTETTTEPVATKTEAAEISTIFAFKAGMTTYFDENGDAQCATLLKYEPLIVSQVKTLESDGYAAVQVAFSPKSEKRTLKSEKNHLKAAGFENGAYHVKEIRSEDLPKDLSVGSKIALSSLKAGDFVKLTSRSKGHGFTGVVKRYHMAGGPATHGSGFHRRPGSSGNRTWPGRVMPGKKFPGHMGDVNVCIKNVKVIDIIPEENVIIVKGPVPGATNTLVKLVKV